jgi:HJR/Mrr/RecB family endonuclease
MQQLWTPESSCQSRIAMAGLALLLMPLLFLAEPAAHAVPAAFTWPVAIVVVVAVIGLLTLVWYFGVSSIATAQAMNTIYAITDRQVIESRPGHTKTYLPRELRFLTVRPGSNNIGDVLFTIYTVPDDEGPPAEVKHGLIGVDRPHDVAAIMRAAFQQAPFAEQSVQLE